MMHLPILNLPPTIWLSKVWQTTCDPQNVLVRLVMRKSLATSILLNENWIPHRQLTSNKLKNLLRSAGLRSRSLMNVLADTHLMNCLGRCLARRKCYLKTCWWLIAILESQLRISFNVLRFTTNHVHSKNHILYTKRYNDFLLLHFIFG